MHNDDQWYFGGKKAMSPCTCSLTNKFEKHLDVLLKLTNVFTVFYIKTFFHFGYDLLGMNVQGTTSAGAISATGTYHSASTLLSKRIQ